MAHKKGVGSSRNGRDSAAQRLGVKRFGGQAVLGGAILVRRAARNSKPAPMSAWVATIRFTPGSPGLSDSRIVDVRGALSAFTPQRNNQSCDAVMLRWSSRSLEPLTVGDK